MGQSQSPPKSCARPSSNMFQNNLALKIKDSAFKKHLSTHAFVRKSNFRDIESKYSKSSDSEKSSCKASKLKSPKQDYKKKNQSPFFNSYNYFTDTCQGVHLSDIQQNEAEYEDEETKRINKTSANETQNGIEKSRKASDGQTFSEKSKKQLFQQGTNIKKESNNLKYKNQSVQHNKQIRINEQRQYKSSDYEQSNLILFTESKKVSQCQSFEPQIARQSHKGSQFLNADLKCHSNLQLQSNRLPSKHQQSGSQTYCNVKNQKKVAKKGKIRSQNEEFHPCIETIIKSRKSPDVGSADIEENQLQKTVINSRKGSYKDENSITIKMQNLYKTDHHNHDINKGKLSGQHLFRSCKKVYASQISIDSEISPPQSPSYYQEKQITKTGAKKLINSKSFKEDLSIRRDSVYQRKSHRQKIRDSLSLEKVRTKLVQSMHNLNLRHETEPQCIMGKSNYSDQAEHSGQNGGQLSLSSRLRSKIREKLSLQKNCSQRSSLSKQQKLSQTCMNNSGLKYKQSRLSVREAIRRMNENEHMSHLQNTQENYFNENIDDKAFSPVMYKLKKNKHQSDLKQQITQQTTKPSQYEIKALKQQRIDHKQKASDVKQQKLTISKSRIKMENRKNVKGIIMFSENFIDRFQENTFGKIISPANPDQIDQDNQNQLKVENTKNNHTHSKQTHKIEYKKKQHHFDSISHLNTPELQAIPTINIQSKIQQQIQNLKYKSPRRTQGNPQSTHNSPKYLNCKAQKNHISVPYQNTKNPLSQNKKPLNFINFSQLQPKASQIINSQKLIKTVSARNLAYLQNDQILTNSKAKSIEKNKQIPEKLINNPIDSKQTKQKQMNLINDYEQFVQELEKLKKIKTIKEKLIRQNLDKLKKLASSQNKISILDLNKQIINEQITIKVQRMNKLKELNKLTKKIDPVILTKSKSSQILREQYQSLSKIPKIKEKRNEKKDKNSLEKDLYYNLSKQMNNLSYFKDNSKSNSKPIKSLKQLNTSSQEYMIDVSRTQKVKHLKNQKVNSFQLYSIPESPQIKYNPWKEHQMAHSKLRKVQKKTKKESKVQYFSKLASRSMDIKRTGRSRQDQGTISLQKQKDKAKLIMF